MNKLLHGFLICILSTLYFICISYLGENINGVLGFLFVFLIGMPIFVMGMIIGGGVLVGESQRPDLFQRKGGN